MNRKRWLPALAILLLAGCTGYQRAEWGSGLNYVSFTHPFTDKAAADVLANARKLCQKQGKAAVQTSNSCTLEQCTTYYQCVDPASAPKSGS